MTALPVDPTLARRDYLAAERVRRTAELEHRDTAAASAARRRHLEADDARWRRTRRAR